MEIVKKAGLERDSLFLRREYVKMLFPVMLSVLAGTVNTLIDGAFIAQKLGADGLAAVNMCGPLYQVICTLGALLAGGASILSAREAGRENREASRKYYHSAIAVCVMLSVFLSCTGTLLCRPLSRFLAQSGTFVSYVYDYSLVTLIGLLPFTLAYIPLYYLQLEGKSKPITTMMIIVIAADLILDWIFLFPMGMGMKGAAAASALSMAAGCIYGFVMLEKGHTNYPFSIKECNLSGWRLIFKYGSPAASGNLMDAGKLFLLNLIILKGYGEDAIAVWAVVNIFSELSLSFITGVPQAAGPMIGVFFTSKENSGIRILMALQVKTGLLCILAYGAGLLLFSAGIGRLFAVDEPLFFPLLCFSVSMIFELLCSIWSSFFNTAGRLWLSNLLVVLKRFLLPVCIALWLAAAGGRIWMFLVVSGAASCVVMALVIYGIFLKHIRTARPLSQWLLLDDYLEREHLVLDFSIKPTDAEICGASEKLQDFCAANHMSARETNRLGLGIEEILMVMKGRILGLKSVDLRAFALEDMTGIRIRCAGDFFDPFTAEEEGEDDFFLGVALMKKLADEAMHSYTLGMNTIYLCFNKKEVKEEAADGHKTGNGLP